MGNQFSKKKIRQSNYIKHELTSLSYVECILLDNNSKILHKYKNIIEFKNKKESFSISSLNKNIVK